MGKTSFPGKLSTLSTFRYYGYKQSECGFLLQIFLPECLIFPCSPHLSQNLSTLSTIMQPLDFTGFAEKFALFIFKNPCYNREQIREFGERIIMADIILNGSGLLSSTCVPNIFIDKYMTNANGEFVKIYLYLIRCMEQSKNACSISELADVFDHTEKDVLRALAYWEKMHLLHLEYDDNSEVSGISLELPEKNAPSFSEQKKAQENPSPSEAKNQYSTEQIEHFQNDEGLQEILFITENYLGRTLNSTDIRTILYWYDGLHFSTDLIEYLIETCISNGHTSLRYMEKIALSWADAGISSVTEAKKEHSLHNKDAYAVMKAFGISGRNLISSELKKIAKWTGSYAFSMDIIREACRRTIQATGKPSFEYADTILSNWHKNNIHTLKDIVKSDSAHQKSKTASKTREALPRSYAGNRFNEFPQRNYNYDQLEKQLLNTTH